MVTRGGGWAGRGLVAGDGDGAGQDVDAGDVQLRKRLGEADGERADAGADVEHPRAGGSQTVAEVAEMWQYEPGEQGGRGPAGVTLCDQGRVIVGGPSRALLTRKGGGLQQW